ncbi:uncharacterized protein Dana_GF21272 [Drosophila ananassae]|uniref:DUF1279 domain-containing protein n=1 Tax=Drosophila ananassae TaxID=7217 RepID=B3MRF9_DROAN|nr:uncharacterized protein C18orf19 homolog A [Drosophila ananassae]EDV34364.1 uncharacterized protein Dana_GF21272 [Drosophila ananassae]
MATVALLTRQRMLACSIRLLGANHFRCLAVAPKLVSNPQLKEARQRSLVLPFAITRRSHKSAPTAAAPAATPVASASSPRTPKPAATTSSDLFGEAANMGLFAKFKHMYKQYWYVLIPVHVITSVGWFGGFYYLSKSGVDVPSLLQYVHLSETIIEKVQGSDMGHYAIAYLCYKVATPLRYALTLGCTTVSIKYLVQHGYIKPIPTKNELIKMYEDKKATRASAKADKAEKAEKDESK